MTDSTPTSGTTFTLSATVRNAGDGASAATTLRFYRSIDSTITTSDTAQGINAKTVTGLAASESSSHSLDILAPPAPVPVYYGACVTAVADESDTTNNCSGSVLVHVQPPQTSPDLSVGSPTVSDTEHAGDGRVVHAVGDGDQQW